MISGAPVGKAVSIAADKLSLGHRALAERYDDGISTSRCKLLVTLCDTSELHWGQEKDLTPML